MVCLSAAVLVSDVGLINRSFAHASGLGRSLILGDRACIAGFPQPVAGFCRSCPAERRRCCDVVYKSSHTTLGERFPRAARVVCDLSFENLDAPEDAPLRHVQATQVLTPTCRLLPIVVTCAARRCVEQAALLPEDRDLLPVVMEMLAGGERAREGEVACATQDGVCATRISYRVECEYEQS
jgi:hypothetical protein